MRKKYIIRGLLILVLFIGIFVVNAIVNKSTAWHSADNVWISIDGSEMTLQSAIDNNMFIGLPKSSLSPTPLGPGHTTSDIWVSVNGDEKTLQDAISTTGLCGSSSNPYTNSIGSGHLASEIEVSISGSNISFQDAIDSGQLVSVDGVWSDWSTWGECSVSCGGGTQTQTRTCTNPSPYCAGADCDGFSSQNQSCNTQTCDAGCQPGTYYSWSGTCTDFCSAMGGTVQAVGTINEIACQMYPVCQDAYNNYVDADPELSIIADKTRCEYFYYAACQVGYRWGVMTMCECSCGWTWVMINQQFIPTGSPCSPTACPSGQCSPLGAGTTCCNPVAGGIIIRVFECQEI